MNGQRRTRTSIRNLKEIWIIARNSYFTGRTLNEEKEKQAGTT